jgi:hypothetical protein
MIVNENLLCPFSFSTMAHTTEAIDPVRFHICEPPKTDGRIDTKNIDGDPEGSPVVSPATFQRGESRESFFRRFLHSNPTSRGNSQPHTPSQTSDTPSTMPSSPNNDPPTPDTAREFVDFNPGKDLMMTPGQYQTTTPTNSTFSTPSVSKRTTGTKEAIQEIREIGHGMRNPQCIAASSMIVPVMLPDKSGNFMAMDAKNEDMKTRMVMRFGILVSEYTKVFLDSNAAPTTSSTSLLPSLQRRRSATFVNVNPRDEQKPKYLLVNQRNDEHARTRSSDAKVHVRLLLSVSDLCDFPFVRMNGEALRVILNDTRNRMSRRPRPHTTEPVDLFFENSFLACQHLSVVPARFVMPPLRDHDGTIVTVNASHILGEVFVKGWPESNEPMVGWYPEDRIDTVSKDIRKLINDRN